jgi:hypothetical protein
MGTLIASSTGMDSKPKESGESTLFIQSYLNKFTTLNFQTTIINQYNSTYEVQVKKDRLSGLLIPRQKCCMNNIHIRQKTGKIKAIREESGCLILTIKI